MQERGRPLSSILSFAVHSGPDCEPLTHLCLRAVFYADTKEVCQCSEQLRDASLASVAWY